MMAYRKPIVYTIKVSQNTLSIRYITVELALNIFKIECSFVMLD